MPHPQGQDDRHDAGGRRATGSSWRVTPHFHPDRLVAGLPVLQLKARDGAYRSQFETDFRRRWGKLPASYSSFRR